MCLALCGCMCLLNACSMCFELCVTLPFSCFSILCPRILTSCAYTCPHKTHTHIPLLTPLTPSLQSGDPDSKALAQQDPSGKPAKRESSGLPTIFKAMAKSSSINRVAPAPGPFVPLPSPPESTNSVEGEACLTSPFSVPQDSHFSQRHSFSGGHDSPCVEEVELKHRPSGQPLSERRSLLHNELFLRSGENSTDNPSPTGHGLGRWGSRREHMRGVSVVLEEVASKVSGHEQQHPQGAEGGEQSASGRIGEEGEGTSSGSGSSGAPPQKPQLKAGFSPGTNDRSAAEGKGAPLKLPPSRAKVNGLPNGELFLPGTAEAGNAPPHSLALPDLSTHPATATANPSPFLLAQEGHRRSDGGDSTSNSVHAPSTPSLCGKPSEEAAAEQGSATDTNVAGAAAQLIRPASTPNLPAPPSSTDQAVAEASLHPTSNSFTHTQQDLASSPTIHHPPLQQRQSNNIVLMPPSSVPSQQQQQQHEESVTSFSTAPYITQDGESNDRTHSFQPSQYSLAANRQVSRRTETILEGARRSAEPLSENDWPTHIPGLQPLLINGALGARASLVSACGCAGICIGRDLCKP